MWACNPASDTIGHQIQGRWNMTTILMDQADVTSEHNPANNRYIIFNTDHTFESGGDPAGKNTGKWEFDESSRTLFLDSDAGEEDDSYWIVSINGDLMHWQGTHFEFNSRFSIDHTRADL